MLLGNVIHSITNVIHSITHCNSHELLFWHIELFGAISMNKQYICPSCGEKQVSRVSSSEEFVCAKCKATWAQEIILESFDQSVISIPDSGNPRNCPLCGNRAEDISVNAAYKDYVEMEMHCVLCDYKFLATIRAEKSIHNHKQMTFGFPIRKMESPEEKRDILYEEQAKMSLFVAELQDMGYMGVKSYKPHSKECDCELCQFWRETKVFQVYEKITAKKSITVTIHWMTHEYAKYLFVKAKKEQKYQNKRRARLVIDCIIKGQVNTKFVGWMLQEMKAPITKNYWDNNNVLDLLDYATPAIKDAIADEGYPMTKKGWKNLIRKVSAN